MPYVLRGFDENFSIAWGVAIVYLGPRHWGMKKKMYDAIASRDDLVILDASFGLESIADGSGISMLSFSIGDSISAN